MLLCVCVCVGCTNFYLYFVWGASCSFADRTHYPFSLTLKKVFYFEKAGLLDEPNAENVRFCLNQREFL